MKSLADKAERAVERLAADYRRTCADIAAHGSEVSDLRGLVLSHEIGARGLRADLARAYADRDHWKSLAENRSAEIAELVAQRGAQWVNREASGVCVSCGLMPDGSVTEEDPADVLAAFAAGAKGVTAPRGEGVTLGVCGGWGSRLGCGEVVLPGQKFDLYRLVWSADFAGDTAGSQLVFTHKDCADVADHRTEVAQS